MSTHPVSVAHGGVGGMIIERGDQVSTAMTRFDHDWTGRGQSPATAFPDVSRQRT